MIKKIIIKTACTFLALGVAVVSAIIFLSIAACGKEVKEDIGEWWVTTYHASDNTPRGSHATSTGAYATEYHTAAVDMHNPLVPYGTVIEVEGLGRWVVEDCGNFGYCNNGRRALDLFFPEGEGGLWQRKIWWIKPETKAERKKRLAKIKKRKQKIARKIKQKREFILKFDPSVPYGEIRTHKGVLPDATVLVEWYHEPFTKFQYLETDANLEGDDNVIYIGDKAKVLKYKKIKFVEVVEGAVG